MPQTNLKEYIKNNLEKGYGLNTIRIALLRWGYSPKDTDPILVKLMQQTPETNDNQTNKSEIQNPFLKLIINPNAFFEETDTYQLNKSMKYLFYSFLVFFIFNPLILFTINLIKKNKSSILIATLLTNTISNLFFSISLLILCSLFLGAVFLTLRFAIKRAPNPRMMISSFSFSIVPYILINSLSNLDFYPIVSIISMNIGFLNLNVFFLWSLALFSLAISKNMNIDYKRTLVLVLIPFFVLLGIIILSFFSAIKAGLLGLVFEVF